MDRIRFFAQQDYQVLEKLLRDRISIWSRDWIFGRDLTLSIEEISPSSLLIDFPSTYSFAGSSVAKVGCIDKEFNWAVFIFNDYLASCPDDDSFDAVVAVVKQSFWSDIFNLKDVPSNTRIMSMLPSYRGAVKISIRSNSVGEIEIFSSHSSLYGLLEKPLKKADRNGITSRVEAVANLDVQLQVKMNFGEINFIDLVTMSDNKQVKSSIDIDNQFYLTIDSAPLCKVAAGKVENFKSVIIQEVRK